MYDRFLVKTCCGDVKGTSSLCKIFDKAYYSFFGIPYATPPIGHLRFKAPKAAKPWSGTLDCTEERSECLQFSYIDVKITGTEDCLYLNVHTSQLPCEVTELKPVIVVIHGGGFTWGGSSCDSFGNPEFIIQHDVVCVTFNYRLHIFGFLNLDLPDCLGNAGLKDQVMVLQWVQQNIKAFGGDPNNVTLYGMSSGATSVHLHMLSPLSKGLFHKAIMACGYALNGPWVNVGDHIKTAFEYGEYAGFTGNSKKKLLNFLKAADPLHLLTTINVVRNVKELKNIGNFLILPFLPSVEYLQEGAFIPRPISELVKECINPVPVITSLNEKEGLFFQYGGSGSCDSFEQNTKEIIKKNLSMYKMDEETLDVVMQRIKNFYCNSEKIRESPLTLTDYYSDVWFSELYRTLRYIANHPSKPPVYTYMFMYEGGLNMTRRMLNNIKIDVRGPTHSDDCGYIIYLQCVNKVVSHKKLTDDDLSVINNMGNLFYNFMKTGNPNGDSTKTIQWNPTTEDTPCYLHFGKDLKIVNRRMNDERFAFWEELLDYIKMQSSKNKN